ncbi:MAG: hypothetical protein ACXVLQ_05215 [Bacteriovorax sp.]
MKTSILVQALPICAVLSAGAASAVTPTSSISDVNDTGDNFSVSYSWMNALINKTPVEPSACPEINTDIYGSGFKVARQKNFFATIKAFGTKHFPPTQIWASVGIGPVKDSFAIYFSDIDNLGELAMEKRKHLPDSYEEVNRWKVSDSAVWESQGGVSFYLRAGVTPVEVGVFAVATGGWSHFLQKTGPNKVYVELARKKIRSIALGAGLGQPNISVEKAFEKAHGFSFEFTLDSQENIEAFERFMAGDVTKAEERSNEEGSGVVKISDMSESRSRLLKTIELATPFLPILSFKKTIEKDYDHVEENMAYGDQRIKDMGIYINQRDTAVIGKKLKEARSFMGGKVASDVQGVMGPLQTEKWFGNFKYAYQSDWGQEKRLRKYIAKAGALTGLVEETCASVPAFDNSLGFNQVLLEVNWSDEYVRELMGLGKSNGNLLKKLKARALSLYTKEDLSKVCDGSDGDNDKNCAAGFSSDIDGIFKNIENYSTQMNQNFYSNNNEFIKNLTKLGQEVWKSPAVFKAFYERGKLCGEEFKFEVSGKRITRLLVNKKFDYSDACSE